MDAAYNQPTSTTPERNWQRDQCCREGGKLERELATVTEERDELKSKYRTHHDEAERITNEICRVSSVCRKLERELAAVTEQRDRLAEKLNESEEEYGLWWAQKRIAREERDDAREQRDRLAGELKEAQDAIEMMLNDSACRRIAAYSKKQLAAVEGVSDE
jgi:chromosome segregation ATPase